MFVRVLKIFFLFYSGEAYDAVVCAALSAEVEGFVVLDAVVDYAVREHGLRGDAEDEDAEGEVLGWFGVGPHV